VVGFEFEDDWLEFRLEHDPRFLQRIEAARKRLRTGCGARLKDTK
jgi:hypothetical protein